MAIKEKNRRKGKRERKEIKALWIKKRSEYIRSNIYYFEIV